MNRVQVYNFTTLIYDTYTGEFERDNEFVFDFPPTDHFDASGNVKFIAQRLAADGVSWTDITSNSSASISESKSTDGVIQIDENGFKSFKASDPNHPTINIDKSGNVVITGTVNATSGTIGNWIISGSILQSADGSISLNSTTNTLTIGSTANNVILSTTNGIIAKKGTIAGWSISGNDLQATNMILTGGTTPQLTIGSNIIITPSLLTINNGAINISTGPLNAVTINSTGIKAMSGSNYALLDNTGLKVVGGAISIETNVLSSTNKMVMNSTGLFAYKDTLNYVRLDSNGVACIKDGTLIGSAITPDGLIGTLLTEQSVPGSKFDKMAPNQPVVLTGEGNTYSYIEQTATSEFINIRVKFNAVSDTDREGYKIYLKEGVSTDTSKLYMPMAIVSIKNEASGTVTYDIRNVKSNTIYCIKVTAYDVTGNESLITTATPVQISAIKDTISPKSPDSIIVLSGFKMIAIRWTDVLLNSDNSPCVDLDYYTVERTIDNVVWNNVAKVYTDIIIDKEVLYDIDYTYRVKAVDLSGNSSTYITSESVSASRVDTGDIVAKSITSELLKIGSIVKSINREETTLFHFDGTLMSTQGLTPFVGSDKVIHQNGFFKKEAKFGASLSIEEDTTNLISEATTANANFKSTTSGWNIGSAQYIVSNGVDGISDGYIIVDNSGTTYLDILDLIPGKPYAISFYSIKVIGECNSVVDIEPLNGTTTLMNNIVNYTITPDWMRVSNSFIMPENTTSIRIKFRSSIASTTVGIDSVQLEQRAYATSFVNGVKIEGYVDYYAQNMISPLTGVIAFWAKNIIGWHNEVDNDHPADSPYIDNWFIWGNENETNKIYAKYDRSNSTCTFMYGDTSLSYVFPESILNDDWIHVGYSWTPGIQTLYINGVIVATSAGESILQPSDILFRLGYFPRKDEYNTTIEEQDTNVMNKRARASLMFDEFRIDKVIRDQDEIQSWFTQSSSFYDAAAQIDADSQNISAANAAVTINNEGITVKDGKIVIESEDGKILLRDGRIQVNGLDVGVAQSENAIYNGNFTISDMSESVGDVYLSEKGLTKTGAKYWNLSRSSGPLFNDVLISMGWQHISPTDYIDSSVIKSLYLSTVEPAIKGLSKMTPIQLSLYNFSQGLMNPSYSALGTYLSANASVSSSCTGIMLSIVQDAVNNITQSISTITTRVSNALSSLTVLKNELIAYTVGVTQSIILSIDMFIEYNIAVNLIPLSPTATMITYCQSAARTAINLYIDNYSTDIITCVTTSLSEHASTFGAYFPTYIGAVSNIVIASEPFIQMYVESQIENKVNTLYEYLMSISYGYVSYNDSLGTVQQKVYQIQSDSSLHEVIIDLDNPDMPFTIDSSTGIPVVSPTPYIGGNTSFYVYPETKLYGRQGFSELSVRGEHAETIQISQPAASLITYTDGIQEKGINFKQYTFSFNCVWKEELDHTKILGSNSIFDIEVEELVPILPLDRDPITGVIPLLGTIPYTTPKRKSSYNFINGKYDPSPAIEYISLDPLTQMPNDDAYISINTLGLGQSVSLGNTEIKYDEYGNVIGYTIKTIKDIMTLSVWNAGKDTYPNGFPYVHAIWGAGIIKDSVLYVGIKTIEEINIDLAPQFVMKTVNTPKDGMQNVINTTHTGDFMSIEFSVYTKCDIAVSILQDPFGGVMYMAMDKKMYGATDSSFLYQTVTNLDLTDFASGTHSFTVMNTGKIGMNTDPSVTNPGLSVISLKVYDWKKLVMPDNNVKNKLSFYKDSDGKCIIAQPGTNLKTGATLYKDGTWNTAYISPNYANSLNPDGSPLLFEMIPIKYKVNMTLSKQEGFTETSTMLLSGIQAELGTNPSYTRPSSGKYSFPCNMIQPYSTTMWVDSGIQTKHFEEFRSGFVSETGIQSRHIADRQIISTKIAGSNVLNEHIAKSNITFDKTRIKKQRIYNKILVASLDYSTLYDTTKYISLQMPSILPSDFFVPAAVQYQSEFIIKNGQILDDEDDYSLIKHIAFISAKDIFDITIEYSKFLISISQPGIIDVSIAERPLTPQEFATLISVIQSVDLYKQPVLYNNLKQFDVLFYTIARMVAPIETINSYTDKIKIQFWEEL